MNGTLPSDSSIEISFDRLLLPFCITRQTFLLQQIGANPSLFPPSAAYDPIARVVTITPPPGGFIQSQPYTLTIASPRSDADPNGLRAFDGALLARDAQSTFGFTAGPPAGNGSPLPTQYIDFCSQVLPIFVAGTCGGCHASPSKATLPQSVDGLALDSPAAVQQTALGRASIEANTGPFVGQGGPTSLLFTQDMPIIDPGPGPSGSGIDTTLPVTFPGNPSQSYMIYKTLMAIPSIADGGSPYTYSVACSDAGASCPQDLSPDERARLSGIVLGREMPYPGAPGAGVNTHGLSLGQLETLSAWISQGAPIPGDAGCP